MVTTPLLHPLTLNRPMVLLPVKEYRALLMEAGYLPTPRLTRQLATARARFRKGHTIPWESLKRELK